MSRESKNQLAVPSTKERIQARENETRQEAAEGEMLAETDQGEPAEGERIPHPPGADEPEARQHDVIRWQAYDHVYYEKGADWYWILGIVVVTLSAIALLLNNVLFFILILLAGFTVALYGSKHPDIIEYEVSRRGIAEGNKLYPYATLDCFWIDESGPQALLLVAPQKTFGSDLAIPLEGVKIGELADFLEEHIPEEAIERPWTQKLIELVGL